MAKQKSNIDSIIENIESAIASAKAEYEVKPSNPLYSVIIDLELTLMETKKLK
jgi:hypothetical protein